MVSYEFSVCAVAVPGSRIPTLAPEWPFHSLHPISLGTNLPNMRVFLKMTRLSLPRRMGLEQGLILWQSLKGLSADLNPSPRAT